MTSIPDINSSPEHLSSPKSPDASWDRYSDIAGQISGRDPGTDLAEHDVRQIPSASAERTPVGDVQDFEYARQDTLLREKLGSTYDHLIHPEMTTKMRIDVIKEGMQNSALVAGTNLGGIDLSTAVNIDFALKRIAKAKDITLVFFFLMIRSEFQDRQEICDILNGDDTCQTKASAIRVWIEHNPEPLQNITELHLTRGDPTLQAIPDEIRHFTSLETLDLSYNEIAVLPEGIGELTKLQTLILDNNRIKTLPATFHKLHALQELYWIGNGVDALPTFICNFKDLQVLLLDDNNLRVLPPSICNLSSLNKLGLTNNQIESLPDSFHKLVSLESLFLRKNPLQALPQFFAKLPALSLLSISGRQLENFSAEIHGLPNLSIILLENVAMSKSFKDSIKQPFLSSDPINGKEQLNSLFYYTDSIGQQYSLINRDDLRLLKLGMAIHLNTRPAKKKRLA
jgi:hypothetical protein